MAKRTKSRLNVHYLTISRPLSREELEEKVREALEKARAGELPKTGKEAGDDVADDLLMKIAMVSADRLKAYDRMQAQDEARDWLMEEMGRSAVEMMDLDIQDIEPQLRWHWVSMLEAADILGALVPEMCENWTPPNKLEDWALMEDYIFDPALNEARRLNPQWEVQAGVNLGNLRPGSRANGDDGTND